ncbi:hypothetical protein AAG570_013539 [Ranatra chinensis]|uniref:Mpv17-like protein 2 n=1 Tax=Ranatra chinensis TaxID=642074 RepID=A0ABD0YR94_9HEMI
MSFRALRSEKFLALVRKCGQIKEVLFDRYLLLTNVGISIGLSGAGDVLQQHYWIVQGEKKSWNVRRTRDMSVSGLTVGILCHYWYNFLDHRLPGKTIKIVLKKVVIDQLFFSPAYISVFFLTMGILEKSSLKEVGQEIVKKGRELYKAEWVIWPPAQIINFYFLPTKYRVLYDSTISLGYDVYTSHVKHEMFSDSKHDCS